MKNVTLLKPSGYGIELSPNGVAAEHDYRHCVHCGAVWVHRRIPGVQQPHYFCGECNGHVCGPGCPSQVPFEQWLENMEHGRELDFRPIAESVL